MREFIKATLLQTSHRLFGPQPLRRFARKQDGAVAVEFSLIAVPFLAIMFAIMETAVIFFAGQALETATSDSARLIMTGQAQTAGYDKAAFKNQVCARVYGLFNCQTGVVIDVQKFSNFGAVTLTRPVDANGNFTDNSGYNPGGPGCITVVRLFYQWPVYLSLGGFNLSDLSGGKRLLAATAAFRNEPYATSSGTC
jgi:Flp pilus assembly protein TadG